MWIQPTSMWIVKLTINTTHHLKSAMQWCSDLYLCLLQSRQAPVSPAECTGCLREMWFFLSGCCIGCRHEGNPQWASAPQNDGHTVRSNQCHWITSYYQIRPNVAKPGNDNHRGEDNLGDRWMKASKVKWKFHYLLGSEPWNKLGHIVPVNGLGYSP